MFRYIVITEDIMKVKDKSNQECEKEMCCMSQFVLPESNCCKKSPTAYGAMVFLVMIVGMIIVSAFLF